MHKTADSKENKARRGGQQGEGRGKAELRLNVGHSLTEKAKKVRERVEGVPL